MEENKTTVKKVIKRVPRKKVCAFCQGKIDSVDYKDVATLKKYVPKTVKSCREE